MSLQKEKKKIYSRVVISVIIIIEDDEKQLKKWGGEVRHATKKVNVRFVWNFLWGDWIDVFIVNFIINLINEFFEIIRSFIKSLGNYAHLYTIIFETLWSCYTHLHTIIFLIFEVVLYIFVHDNFEVQLS